MIFFITVLRAVATCMITNSHYEGIYPTDIIANGGLLGDILFFAVSGYCLYNVRNNFFRWYGKRLYRIYLPIIFITVIYMIAGFYKIDNSTFVNWFIYPTNYHFAASIIILYIPYYIVFKSNFLKKHIPAIMALVGIGALAYYMLAYDKSVYRIDNVNEPFIRILFFESMLLGGYFKQNDSKYRNRFSVFVPVLFVISFVLYFASKMLFVRKPQYTDFQIINQFIILVVLYFLFRLFASIDKPLTSMPKWIKSVLSFLADMTLEIYVVQSVLIILLRNVAPFPLNWVAVTVAIIAAAFALHLLCKYFMKLTDFII